MQDMKVLIVDDDTFMDQSDHPDADRSSGSTQVVLRRGWRSRRPEDEIGLAKIRTSFCAISTCPAWTVWNSCVIWLRPARDR